MQAASKQSRAVIEATLAKSGVESFAGDTVYAYLNHDRWVADCPFCNGAELVATGLPMLCGSCGAEHKVVFPRNRKQIEAALLPREGRLRNWLPGESVDDLWAQNIDHGIFPEGIK